MRQPAGISSQMPSVRNEALTTGSSMRSLPHPGRAARLALKAFAQSPSGASCRSSSSGGGVWSWLDALARVPGQHVRAATVEIVPVAADSETSGGIFAGEDDGRCPLIFSRRSEVSARPCNLACLAC